ncbi:MAG: hypothetical protein ACRENQ_02030 [Gemmatimonadaceae bacterium]
MRSVSRLATVIALGAVGASTANAQTPVVTPLQFSGVVYADWQNGGTTAQRATNKFDLTRAYLNFVMPSGDNVTVRVTTDVYQNTNTATSGAYYSGWTARLKYAFMQWSAWQGTGTAPASLSFRFGLEQTPEIDMMEGYWQRGITNTPLDYFGFGTSSDLGAVVMYTLPGKQGNFYGGVFNGNGYGSYETNRFKNVNVRFSWTPLASSEGVGVLTSLAISPYYQKGYNTNAFDATAPGLQNDLWGIHAAIQDPRVTVGAEYDRRTTGSNTAVNANVTTVAGAVYSAFTIVRPFAFINHTKTNPWSLVLRADQYTPNTATGPYQRFLIGGIGYDISSKTTVYADLQNLEGHNYTANAPDSKAFYFHFVIGF